MTRIKDDNFSLLLHDILKKRKINKKERTEIVINALLNVDHLERDAYLDDQDTITRRFLLKKQELKKVRTELQEQADFVKWFRSTYKGVVIHAIRNGGSRTPKERADQLREGVWAGVTDLHVPEWHLWIEFKRVKGGVLSKKQIIFRDYVLSKCRGDSYILARGFEDGKKKVIEFLSSKIT